jgi:hypothetical protein
VSIAVLVSVHDGLVLAADSASSLMLSTGPALGIANVYDNANKIFNIVKGYPLGCITFGTGSIGNASIGTLIKDLRAKLTDKKEAKELDFDPDGYTMEQVAGILAKFLGDECSTLKDEASMKVTNVGLLVAGYSNKPKKESLGEAWSVEIIEGVPKPPNKLREKDQVGINWGGQAEVLQRMVLGFSPQLFQVLAEAGKSASGEPVTAEQIANDLSPLLMAKLQAGIVYAPMPIQDAIDLGRFLVHSAIMYSRFLPGAQVVGGPIEIAAITKHEGFKWISRKHYYEQRLNREPSHVILDRQDKN